MLACIVLLILLYSIISKKSFLEKGFKKTKLGTLLVLVYIFVTVTSCWYTLYLVRNMNVNHFSPSEVIGKYERAYESNSCYETLTLKPNSTYIHYYKNKKDGKVYNDTGKWEYLDSKNNKVRFYKWVFREKNDFMGKTYDIIYKTYVYERKEYIVLARGVDDISNDLRKLRVLP